MDFLNFASCLFSQPLTVGPPGVGPPGVDSDDESHPDRKLPSLLSLKVEPPVEVKEVKLPIALEQALAFKTERAKQIGLQPEDYVKLGEELLDYGSRT
jgi:splicing factor 3B subunit 2